MADEVKLVKLKKSTYDRLTVLGKKNETYDDIIQSLLDEHDSKTN